MLLLLIGALCFTYFPYHLFDLYKRGSIGEIIGLAVVPLSFGRLKEKIYWLSSLGLALLILSHNTLALLFLPIILIYLILQKLILKKYYFFYFFP